MKSNQKEWKPSGWQTNPDHLNPENKFVQCWKNDVMITGRMPLQTAKEKVIKGEAYIITDQAISIL